MLWTSSQAFSFQLNLKLYCTSHLIGPSNGRIQYPCWKSARLLHTVPLNVERPYFWSIITGSNIWEGVRIFQFLFLFLNVGQLFKLLSFYFPHWQSLFTRLCLHAWACCLSIDVGIYACPLAFLSSGWQTDIQHKCIEDKKQNIFWMPPAASHWMSCSKGNGSLIYHEDWDKNSRNLSGAMPIV